MDTPIISQLVRDNLDKMERCKEEVRKEWLRIGEEAKRQRKQAGMSVSYMAYKLGISAIYVYDLERGNRAWPSDLAKQYTIELGEYKDAKEIPTTSEVSSVKGESTD